ncbi:MAG: hypothetical protein ABI140_20015 [Jatrophihabitantaceae bacterium]
MSQLDQFAAGALIRARPWDVLGAALAAPMVVWGFLGWFGTVGDSAGGQPGFFAGTGAAGIGLVLAASALALNQLLAGLAHHRVAPPVAVWLAGAATIVILGGLIAKPDSVTIQAGSVAGLLTAASQCAVLVFGWLRGSEKSVKAANVRAVQAQQDAADLAAAQLARAGGYPAFRSPGYPQAPPPRYPAAQYPASTYPAAQYPTSQYPAAQYPTGQQPAGQYPPAQYPAAQYPTGQQPAGQYSPGQYPAGQYPYPQAQFPAAPNQPRPGQYPYPSEQNPYGRPPRSG